jgi:hypothetical protein
MKLFTSYQSGVKLSIIIYVWPFSRAYQQQLQVTKSYHLCRIDNQIISVAAVVSAIWHRALSRTRAKTRVAPLSHTEPASERAKLSFPSTTEPTKCNAPGVCCAAAGEMCSVENRYRGRVGG